MMVEQNIAEKIEKLRQLSKPKKIVTLYTINDIKKKLQVNDIDEIENVDKYLVDSELLAYLYQGAGVKIDDNDKSDSTELYRMSYDIWKVVYYSSERKRDKEFIKKLYYLSCMGILSGNIAEVKMSLNNVDLQKVYENIKVYNWPNYFENSLYIILLAMIRKSNGWDDIEFVQTILDEILKIKESTEEDYLNSVDNDNLNNIIYWIAALYNLLEVMENLKKYTLCGKPENVEIVVDRLFYDALELLGYVDKDESKFMFELSKKVIKKLVRLSVWTNVDGISEKIDEYLHLITLKDNNEPKFELLPSQCQAIEQNLFDSSKTATIVQMPTSAGKTMLAKFYILQMFNLYTNPIVAYIVPTRALVNQVKRDLETEFNQINNINVNISVPYNDLEDMEQKLLLEDTNVIVTTPEKLDILVKSNNLFLENLKLVVVDEAHNIQEQTRGPKLELLLAMLRKEKRNLKILLLSPFVENAEEISKWLGGNRGNKIEVNWKPSQQFTGVYKLDKELPKPYNGIVTYIPSSLSTMYNKEFSIKINEYTRKDKSKLELSSDLALKYMNIGGVLILCINKQSAEHAAIQCSEKTNKLDDKTLSRLGVLLNLVKNEMGEECSLYKCIEHGCAYHHSALSLMIREEIEKAIGDKLITIVAATTTLAQGMNFPISTVIFQGISIPMGKYSRDMTSSEFWNIAGRAGRVFVDKEGHVISVCNDDNDVNKFKDYLSNRNQEVLSSLIKTLDKVSLEHINLNAIKENVELSSLLQYIYHINMVDPDIRIDELLRGSLVYQQLENQGEADKANKLIQLTNNYINKISKDSYNLRKCIDKTGLSSLSYKFLLGQDKINDISIVPQNIFDKNNNDLSNLIDIVNKIPEINLSIMNKGQFDSKVVANITTDWVNGKSLKEISDNLSILKNKEERLRECGNYINGRLTNNLPWGISAIQSVKAVKNSSEIEDNTNDIDSLVPSYIYFGVKTKEAVSLCMLGVPRFVAEILGRRFREQYGSINDDNIIQLKLWLNHIKSSEEMWIKHFTDKQKEMGLLAYRLLFRK